MTAIGVGLRQRRAAAYSNSCAGGVVCARMTSQAAQVVPTTPRSPTARRLRTVILSPHGTHIDDDCVYCGHTATIRGHADPRFDGHRPLVPAFTRPKADVSRVTTPIDPAWADLVPPAADR